MKKCTIVLIAIFATIAPIACHTQVPPPSPQPTVTLTCTAPSGATAGYGYIFSRATCTSATSCPANTPGNTNFTALNQSSPAATCGYTDTAPPAGNVIYTVSAIFSGVTGQPSAPSNGGTPISVPVYPGSPGTLNGTQVAALAPPVKPDVKPLPVDAKIQGPVTLTAKLEK